MSRIRIDWNIEGFRQLRYERGVVDDAERRGRAVQAAAGGEAAGYYLASEHGARDPQGRQQVSVIAGSEEARIDNAIHHTLLRALNSGR